MRHATAIGLLIILGIVAGCANSKHLADHEALLGMWYLQQSYGLEVEPGFGREQQLYITFHADGSLDGINWYGDAEFGTYVLDPKDRTIQVMADTDSGLLRYAIIEDVLLLGEVPEPANADEPLVVLEWARTPKGSERQQALDHLISRSPLPSQMDESNERLGQLLRLILREYERSGSTPVAWGRFVIEQGVDPSSILLPWTERPLPDNYDDAPEERQALILSAWSEYIYLYGETFGGETPFDPTQTSIVLFEYPFYDDVPDVAVGFSDGTVRRMPRSEFSPLLKAQTGYALADWWSILN